MKKQATAPFSRSSSSSSSFSQASSPLLLQQHDVVCSLLLQADPVQALRLALTTPRLRKLAEDARAALVARACRRGRQPVASLLAALALTCDPWERACLTRHVLEHGDTEATAAAGGVSSSRLTACMLSATRLSQLETALAPYMDYRYVSALPIYEERLGLPHDDERTRSPFTYQYAKRQLITKKKKPEGEETKEEEILQRRFLMLADAQEAHTFMRAFYRLQHTAAPQEKITLLECGTYDRTWRKWILDIDAPLCDLRNAGLSTDVGVLWVAVLDLAHAVARTLHRAGFTSAPCPFAIVSRHAPDRKCSWHVTLCAYADYARWRQAMAVVEREASRTEYAGDWSMMPFVDQATLRNSRSQFMQVWGSTKVAPGVACDGNCFRGEGVWASTTDILFAPHEEAKRGELFAAATSLVLHDPWSIPFVGLAAASALDAHEQVLKKKKHHHQPTPQEEEQEESSFSFSSASRGKEGERKPRTTSSSAFLTPTWANLPPDSAWMRAYVDDGRTTRLHYIPSMADPANVPYTVSKARAVWVHAQVSRYACCPRMLLGGVVHQHTNTGMLYCFEDAHGRARMWIRCFSTKCRVHNADQSRQRERGWTEVYEDDMRLLQRGRAASSSSAAEPQQQKQKTKREEDLWQGIPQIHAAWMRAPWASAALVPNCETRLLPPCLGVKGTVVVKLYAHVEQGGKEGWLCPRMLCRDRVRHFHAKDDDGSYRVLVVEQSSPKCIGRSYRLFVRCMHKECAHIVTDPQSPWTELTRLGLQAPAAK